MPRVSDAHKRSRRDQILGAAERCFAAAGFHGASMDDICRAAGLSPGAVYRYFGGKDAIIEELATRRLLRDVDGIRETVAAARSAIDALGMMVDFFFSADDENPPADVVREGQASGEIDAALDSEALASALLSLHPGETLQRALGLAPGARAYASAIRALLRGLRPASATA
jgi:AcrR family transcriptional regulator